MKLEEKFLLLSAEIERISWAFFVSQRELEKIKKNCNCSINKTEVISKFELTEKKLKEKIKENDILRETYTNFKKTNEEENDFLNKKIFELENQLILNKTNEKFHNEFSDLKNETNQFENKENFEEKNEFFQKNNNLKIENSTLKESLKFIQENLFLQNNEFSLMKKKYNLENKNFEKNNQIEDNDKVIKINIQNLKEENKLLNFENKNLQRELIDLKENKIIIENKINSYESLDLKLKNLTNKLTTLEKINDNLNVDLKKKKEKIKELDNFNNELINKNEKIVNEFQNQSNELIKEINFLKEENLTINTFEEKFEKIEASVLLLNDEIFRVHKILAEKCAIIEKINNNDSESK